MKYNEKTNVLEGTPEEFKIFFEARKSEVKKKYTYTEKHEERIEDSIKAKGVRMVPSKKLLVKTKYKKKKRKIDLVKLKAYLKMGWKPKTIAKKFKVTQPAVYIAAKNELGINIKEFQKRLRGRK